MKTKYILLLVLALLIGVLIGSLTTGRVTRKKVEKIKSWNTREGFRTHLFDIMEATKDQQEKLRPMLDSFSDLHWKMINKNWEVQNEFYDEMYKSIEPKIEKQQFKKLMDHRDEIRSERQKKRSERKD
ncbi:MAG: hypothetical protein FD155_2842 [Bacteroidetes bacterium]|nr:MAG: hypothetical protein FD155_2842 [Bacteroidota bacterium]